MFLLKPVPFCKLFAGLGSTNRSAPSLFLLSDSRSVLVTFSSPCFWKIWQDLSSLTYTIGLQWVFGHSFHLANVAADEQARRRALLLLSPIPCRLSPVFSRIHFSLFSDWRRTVSSKFFDTQVSSISTKKLVLSRLHCVGPSPLLSSYF